MDTINLQKLIDGHDLTYAYSDDGNCWRRGQAQYDAIIRGARLNGNLDKAASMFAEKCARVLSRLDDRERFVRGFVNDLTNPAYRV